MTCQIRSKPERISRVAAPSALAGQHQLVNFQAVSPAVLEQTRAGIELERRGGAGGADIRFGARLHDEAAADAVVLFVRQYLQRGIVSREAHAVGMPRQHLIHVKQKIERLVERDLVPPQQANTTLDANSMQRGFDGGGIDGVGTQALETQKDGSVRAMAAAGQCKGSVQLRRHLSRALEQVAGRQ